MAKTCTSPQYVYILHYEINVINVFSLILLVLSFSVSVVFLC